MQQVIEETFSARMLATTIGQTQVSELVYDYLSVNDPHEMLRINLSGLLPGVSDLVNGMRIPFGISST